MIRDQIESMLDIRGKDLPSADEVLGLGDIREVAAWNQVKSQDEVSHKEEEEEEILSREEILYSDYTEKLQSLLPECECVLQTQTGVGLK